MIITILLIVYIGAREYFGYLERQKLLDRIQARDFTELKACDQPKPKKQEKKQEGDYL